MNKTFETILELVHKDQILISDHGYDELVSDDVLARDILAGVKNGIIVEDYPNYSKGPPR